MAGVVAAGRLGAHRRGLRIARASSASDTARRRLAWTGCRNPRADRRRSLAPFRWWKRRRARRVFLAAHSHLGERMLGITGPNGAGKSTLVNAIVGELLMRGKSVAVVAVDPSSPFTGGAVLGDRIRMAEHQADERVFIRSLASRGHHGGVSRATGHVIDVFTLRGLISSGRNVGADNLYVAIPTARRGRCCTPPGSAMRFSPEGRVLESPDLWWSTRLICRVQIVPWRLRMPARQHKTNAGLDVSPLATALQDC